jgi:hypothetical protein
MRTLVLAFAAMAALALGACAPRTAARCNLEASHELAFTAADARDTVLAQAIGPSCDKAIGLYVIRAADGYPIWSWSAPLAHHFGDVFAAEDHEHVQAFLDSWVEPQVSTTQSAPAWDALVHGQTSLDRLTYEDIRARNLPMLCHFSGTARQTCVFWEPAAGGAGHFLDRDVAEESEG